VSENEENSLLGIGKVIVPDPDSEEKIKIGEYYILESYRIIHLDIKFDSVFAINLDTTAKFPIELPYREVLKKLDEEVLILCDFDEDPRLDVDEDFLPEGFKKKAKRRLKDIIPLTLDIESVLRNGYGDEVFASVAESSNRSIQYIRDTWYSYVLHLGAANCLGLPQGKNAHTIPKERKIYVKQGAPNKGIAKGKRLDKRDYEAFEYGKRYYEKNGYPSLKKVLRKVYIKFYCKNKVKLRPYDSYIAGETLEYEFFPPDERPSFYQFEFWLKKSMAVIYQKLIEIGKVRLNTELVVLG